MKRKFSPERFYRPYLTAALIYLIATIVFTWPFVLTLASSVPDKKDTIIHIWKLGWGAHALTTPGAKFWEGAIFYPAEHSNALEDSHAGILPFYWPIAAISGNPVLGHNVALLLTFFLSAMAMFMLAMYWTNDGGAALAAGLVFGFNPSRLTALPEIHMLTWQWAPLIFLFMERYFREGRWRDGALAAVFLFWQLASSLYLTYIIAMGIFFYIIIRFFWGNIALKKVFTRGIALATTFLILSFLFLKPYLANYTRGILERPLDHIVHGSLSLPDDLISAYYWNWLYGRLFQRFGEGIPIKQYFPGISVILLGAAGIIHLMKSKNRKSPAMLFVILMAAGFGMALGPYLVIWEKPSAMPLPYLFLLKILPGLSAMRVPARFMYLAILAGSVLVAFGAKAALAWLGEHRISKAAGTALITLVLSAEFISVPIPLDPIPSLKAAPPVYKWLRGPDGPPGSPIKGAVLEIPFDGPYFDENYMYMYYNLSHFRPIANGVTSFIPEYFNQLQRDFQYFPAKPLLDSLRSRNIRTLIVHADRIKWVPAAQPPDHLLPFARIKRPWGWKYVNVSAALPAERWMVATSAQTLAYLNDALQATSSGAWLSALGCVELRLYEQEQFPMDTILICPAQGSLQPGEEPLCNPARQVAMSALITGDFIKNPQKVIEAYLSPAPGGLLIKNIPPYPYEIPKWSAATLEQNGLRLIKRFGNDLVYLIE